MRGNLSFRNILKKIVRILSVVAVFGTSHVGAQTSTAQMESVATKAVSKKYSFSIGTEYQTNLRKNSSPDQDNSTSLSFVGEYELRPKSFITAEMDIIRSHKSDGSTQLSNLALAYNPSEYQVSSELTLKPLLYAILPTNESARDDQTFNGAIMVRPVLRYQPAGLQGLTISNSIYIGKQFHTYDIQRNYAQNIEYIFRYRFDAGYKLFPKVSVGGRADFIRGWTYSSFAKDSFYLMQYLGYQLSPSLSTYVAHENQGAVRGPNNYGNNIEFFDEKSSYVSVGITHVF